MYVTNRDLTVDIPAIHYRCIVKAGTQLVNKSGAYAVASIEYAVKAGLSEWDAQHHYLWVPADAVTEVADEAQP